MDPGFTFDAGSSDEELERKEEEEEEEEGAEEEGEEEEGEGDEEEGGPRVRKKAQSPWDFSGHSKSVEEEHALRNTTSIDDKIFRARLERQVVVPEVPGADDAAAEEDKRESFKLEEEESGATRTEASTFFSSSDGACFHANSFIELNLSRPLLRACEALGYQKPTPIQAACIPLALTGRDICGSAITGSGKTAAFSLPVLERLIFRPKRVLAIRVLVLTPTRELAVQVHSMIEKLAQFTDIRCCLVVGGLSMKMQEAALRSRPDIVVATPGRMIDHLRNSQSVGLEELAILILDEADRLLELGFSAEINELVKLCPRQRQTMLFSATMTDQVDELVKLSLNKPVRLAADPSMKRPATLSEEVVRIRPTREANKEAILLSLCSRNFVNKVIIFCGTRKEAHLLKILFGLAGFKAAELHGDLTQAQRLDALELFRKQQVDFLIATDVAARGLDIIGVQTVVNFSCPQDINSYVHRVGRTARAGRGGHAVTFITERDRSLLKGIVKKAGSKLLSRTVAETSVVKWCNWIEQMEDQVAEILQEEREERALRRAEMEAAKAEHMIEHKTEIFSRPKKTWFETGREKKLAAKAAKASKENHLGSVNTTLSVQQSDDQKEKEKRQREREKSMPRKKRRRLEAAREAASEGHETTDLEEVKDKKQKVGVGKSLVDIGYRRAKSVKASQKAQQAGKIVGNAKKKLGKASHRHKSRKEEMKDLFQSEMSSKKREMKTTHGGGRKKNSKNSFKSKSRYKRK
ncbi:DEAD-box ATP-dependent RNA helicase 28 [Nymphaea colorata]|nr:DEAD-box ATP-dependent RNA helicase 28 [Nymphaea colorata]